ncbi:MAG TPA: winged helix-turn-helix domain-containing protein [Bryobacteraceae bacterium]|jgi:DNA-binding winged helix-turn-helix (wHTH) protein|nr:winged helix-turn-helix domain-containing protein [Bryobacteraceae bacterium]
MYEFRPDTQELRKDGTRIRVQTKPLQILRMLIERPGELITREELQKELWPDGTFVDFEGGLNTATNRLRAALNDSAEQPRYIETLPRLGYRFICPVKDVTAEAADLDTPQPVAAQVVTTEGVETRQVNPTEIRSLLIETKRSPLNLRLGVTVLVVSGALTALTLYSHLGRTQRPAQPVFHPLTYRAGALDSARFVGRTNTAMYSEWSELDGARTFLLKLDTASGPCDVRKGTVLAVSSTGNILMRTSSSGQSAETLRAVSSSGNPINLNIADAVSGDWLPGGEQVALLRRMGIESLVEFPAGHIVYRSSGWISNLRISPDGKFAAFVEHPMRDDDRGFVAIVDRNGGVRRLTADWNSATGLAWSNGGREVWFTASKSGILRNLYAVSTSGVLRRLSNAPTSLRLFDIAPDGRLLMAVDEMHSAMLARFPGEVEAADVSQFDDPNVQAISNDGQRILFTESGDAGGQHYKTLLLERGKHASRLIGPGRAAALSPDGRLALLIDPEDNDALTLAQLDGGSARHISGGGLHYQWARFLTRNAMLAGASYPNGPLMLYRQTVSGGAPEALDGLPFVDYPVVAPDGCRVAGRSSKDVLLVNICDKTTRRVPAPSDALEVAWSADGRSLIVGLVSKSPPSLVKLDITTDALTTWKTLYVPQPSGFGHLGSLAAAPDVNAYAYSFDQQSSRLYLVEGVS